MVDITLGQATDQDSEMIMKKIKATIKNYMLKGDIKIATGFATTTKPVFRAQETTVLPTRESMKVHYEQLMQGKVQTEDLKNSTRKYAEVLLQQNTFCNLRINLHNGLIGAMKVICCLPEHGQAFVNWWIKQQVDSQNWLSLIQKFNLHMKKYNIATVISKNQPQVQGKHDVVSINMEFNHV